MKFSILIPTKDRLDLLKYVVESILRQTYKEFEIIISDNNSNQDIQNWVNGFADERIVYYRQKSSVSVTENWNKANDMASGDYVIMLGDDDALFPDSLQTLNEYIQSYHFPQLIEFPAYHYLQPNVDPIETEGNVQASPLLFSGEKAGLISLEERQKRVRECFHFNYTFGFNMQFYCYSREIVNAVKQFGDFYEPPYPDYYTACMMMLVADTVLHIPEKITIIGITRKSYGFFFRNNIEKEGMKFHKEADYRNYAPDVIRDKLCSVDEIHTAAIATFSLIPMRMHFEKPDLVAYYKQVVKRELKNCYLSDVFRLIEMEILPNMVYNYKNEVLHYTLDALKEMEESVIPYEELCNTKLSFPNILAVIENIKDIDKHLNDTKSINPDQENIELMKVLNKIRVDALKHNISEREVLIWGAYDRGNMIKKFLDRHKIKIAGFIDQNPNIHQYFGLPVWSPEYIKNQKNKYYIMIPLRTVVPPVIELLVKGNYQYMNDFYYLGYIDKQPKHDYTDLYHNIIVSSSNGVSFDVLFHGYNCELNVTDEFKTQNKLLTTFYGNDVKLFLGDSIHVDNKNNNLKQIKVEYGCNTKQEPTIDFLECFNQAVEIPARNGYTLIYNSDKLLVSFEVTP